MSETKTRRRGRPPKGPKSGKGHVLTTRITADTRSALEAEAARTGRSISQVAELWIEQARRDTTFWEERLGGKAVAPVLAGCGAHAQMAEQWAALGSMNDAQRLVLLWETVRDQVHHGFAPLVWAALRQAVPGDGIAEWKARTDLGNRYRNEARELLSLAAFPPENDRENEILFGATPFRGEPS